ncbi:hypothetical protein TKK_0012477 [Trichogramma kaykai]
MEDVTAVEQKLTSKAFYRNVAYESLNDIITSKNPKSRHYAALKSLCFRVGAGIAQKNLGTQYSTEVYEKLGYFSDVKSVNFKQKTDKARELQNFNSPLILLAHNGAIFDHPRIIKFMSEFNLLDRFYDSVKGFADLLIILRKILPERIKEKKSFSVAALMRDYPPKYQPVILHNAVEDVEVLKNILWEILNEKTIIDHSKSIQDVQNEYRKNKLLKVNSMSLQFLRDTFSSRLINKMAEAGISKDILSVSFTKMEKRVLQKTRTANREFLITRKY